MPDDSKRPSDDSNDSTHWADRAADEVRDAGRAVADGTVRAGTAVANGAQHAGDAVASGAARVGTAAASGAKTAGSAISSGTRRAGKAVADVPGAVLSFLSMPEILKWTETITKSTATIYDKALDAEFLRTHIGGGNHRLFDGGHDIVSAWGLARDASDNDSFTQEVIGYASALWKDATTTMGLPFTTVDKSAYNEWAEAMSAAIPGVNKSWLYDLVSFDAFEVFGAGLGAVGLLFALSKDDQEKLSEILGAMGISAIISANPLMGLAAIATTGYAYWKKKRSGEELRLEAGAAAKGAAVAGVSAGLFMIMGLPILVELVIVIALTSLLQKHILDNETVKELVGRCFEQSGDALKDGVARFADLFPGSRDGARA